MRLPIRLACSALLALAAPLAADPGMWMPQQIPALGDELRELGLEIDPDRFADLTAFPMNAIVSLGGCSAAFVSPRGLIVTNHHCVYGALAYNSTPERDLLANGFLARTPEEELPALPNARVYVTTAIEDVTDEVLGGLAAGLSDPERARAVEDRRKAITSACEAPGGLRCRVSSFFGGESFLKLVQLELRDVRLVYAPASGIGRFGGEVDNWQWPRHTGDFGFYRAYVGPDGRPADYAPENVPYPPAHHLKISTRDLDPGDLVLLAGYPGRTSRLVTSEEVREAQEEALPAAVRLRQELVDVLAEENRRGRDVQIANANRIRGLENYLKKYEGVLAAFDRDDPLAEKLADERAIETALADDPAELARYRQAHEEWLAVLADQRATRERDTLFAWLGTASPMLGEANDLWRNALERAKPEDADRKEGFQQRDWPKLRQAVERAQKAIEPGSDRAGLRWILRQTQELPADQRLEAIDRALAATGAEGSEAQIDALLDRLYAGTRVGELAFRLRALDLSPEALRATGDPLIALAADLRPLGDAIEEGEKAREGAELRLRPELVKGLRAARDGRLAPDANGTLRVGFGVVKGYAPADAVVYEPQTSVEGVLAKSTGEEPFASPPRLLELAREGAFATYVDPDLGTLPVAFLTTVNVTNGSSGSSAINAWGEIVGLAFDMNWEGIAADWVVDEDLVRTVNVDSRYMLWVMDAVDGAHELLREMGLPVRFPAAGE